MRRMGRAACGKILAGLVVVSGSSLGNAAADEGFRTPSGNIMCYYSSGELRCDVMQMTNRPPPRPSDCEQDWGSAFAVTTRSARGFRICAGDTVAGNYRTLGYGKAWRRDGISCSSAKTGLTCKNRRGAGFQLSRAKQRVF